MTDVNKTDITNRIYLFLAQQGDWVSAADQNGDGYIVKAEFRDLMENFDGWDGETTEEGKNDIINSFWKTLDTKQSGDIRGANLKNKNALDANELATLDKKIAMYEILSDFTAELSAPNVVSDAANWKKSVSDGLAAFLETYIKNGGNEEGLLDELKSASVSIENKATADYCANEYLSNEMGSFSKEYGYTYADDNTLQGIIYNYIQNIPEGADAYDIQDTVVNIIDAYLATAGQKSGSTVILNTYGYNPGKNSELNDLQKSILKKTLETDLAAGNLKEDYENNPELFAEAIESYLSTIKYTDFENVSKNVLKSFKSSDIYEGLEMSLEVQALLTSEDLKNALAANISESIANKIIEDGKYLSVMDEIQANVMEKAQNGEFDAGGRLDTQKAIDYLVDQVSARLSEFYPNGFGDMSLNELNIMYDKLVESAEKQTDNDKALEAHRNAAIEYCKALSTKSSKFAEIVNNAFDGDYTSAINKMLPSEINDAIQELKDEATKLGEANELVMTDSSWNISEVQLGIGKTSTFTIKPAFTDKNGVSKSVTTDRITYSSSNTGLISIDSSGNATVHGTTAGSYTAKVSVMVDNVKVGEKTITVTVYENPSAGDIKNKGIYNGKTFADILNNNSETVCIKTFSKNTDLNGPISEVQKIIDNVATSFKAVLPATESASVDSVATTLKNYYTAFMQNLGFGSDGTVNFTYVDANGNSQSATESYSGYTARKDDHADNVTGWCGDSSSGIGTAKSTGGKNKHAMYIDVGNIITKFLERLGFAN